MEINIPTLSDIQAAQKILESQVLKTPVWPSEYLKKEIESNAEVWLKLELFQLSGTFKLRGALLNMMSLNEEELARGVTAVSAGNHAIAVSTAAKALSTSAKVVMMITSNPERVETCRNLGAEVILAENVHAAFEEVQRIEEEEGRIFVHPFEGEKTALGTATLGLELCQQIDGLEAVLVPIGGGGLCAGVSASVKQWNPSCKVYGIEPVGADSMHKSFEAGSPQSIDTVNTIADSLGAPLAMPYSYSLCKKYVDQLVKITDDQMRQAMRYLFKNHKLACEPACAASTAAFLGPLSKELKNKKTALILCGSNIDLTSFHDLIQN